MQKMMGLMRKCIDDYHMISPGDKIAVGVSGGKDSLTLLYLLAPRCEAITRRPLSSRRLPSTWGLTAWIFRLLSSTAKS